MINNIIFALWFFLPAGLANAAPVFAGQIPFLKNWNAPLDFGKSFRGRRIFGDNKTWRGVITGVIVAGIVAFVQNAWVVNLSFSLGLPLLALSTAAGMLMGLGALLGDAIESFFKRQVGIADGHRWFPFDQLDYVIGGLIASRLIIQLTSEQYITIIVTWFVMHIIAVFVAYLLGLKDRPI